MVGTNGATTLFLRRFCAIYVVQMNYQVFADVEGYNSSAVFFASCILDIIVINNDILYAIKLTVSKRTFKRVESIK